MLQTVLPPLQHQLEEPRLGRLTGLGHQVDHQEEHQADHQEEHQAEHQADHQEEHQAHHQAEHQVDHQEEHQADHQVDHQEEHQEEHQVYHQVDPRAKHQAEHQARQAVLRAAPLECRARVPGVALDALAPPTVLGTLRRLARVTSLAPLAATIPTPPADCTFQGLVNASKWRIVKE